MRTLMRSLLKWMMALVMMITLASCGKLPDNIVPGGNEKPEEEVLTVPDFTGLTRADAEAWVDQHKIDPETVFYKYEYNETVAAEKIFDQSVPHGEPIPEEGLTLTISNGVDPNVLIEFPDFTDMTPEEIQQWFIDEHFEHVSVEYVYQKDQPVGKFIGTNMENNQAYRNQPVVIRISGDPKQAGVAVTVPNMSGWAKGQAEEWANMNQITIDYAWQHSASVAAGYVITFAPNAESEIVKGDHIQVVLSSGNEIEAISLTNKTRDQIEAWGQENGIQISWIQCWNAARSGTVYWNEPNSGTMKMGDIMRCYISVGPIPVKDYTGLQYQGNFMGWLNSINSQYNSTANLKVAVTEQYVNDQESGIILSQNPASGYINPSGTISLLVTKKVAPEPTPTPKPSQDINIPNMAGFSEFDFTHALHAYGVVEGTRSTQYSSYYKKDYVIYNATGTFKPGAAIDYVVSLGEFDFNGTEWMDHKYYELEEYINSANRRGASVVLYPSYIDTGNYADDGKIVRVEGPLDDNSIHVRVLRYSGLLGNTQGN